MNKPWEIVLVRSKYSPHGGAETFTRDLIQSLLAVTRTEIVLLTLPNQNWPLHHPRLKIIPVGALQGHRLWIAWSFNHAVRRYLRLHPAEIVMSVDQVQEYTHLHAGGGSHATFLEIKNRQNNLLQRLFRKLSLFHIFILHMEKKGVANPNMKKIICCSAMIAEEFHRLYHIPDDKVHVCYNAIDFERIGSFFARKAELADQLCQKFAIDPNRCWLLFLGSGFERKGLDIALHGLRFMPDNYNLLVVGKGNTRKYKRLAQKLRISQRVRFMGPQPEGWHFASICKGLVHPSRYEPFGLAVAESQAMGIPVLVSTKTGYAEIVQPGQTGVIMDIQSSTNAMHRSFAHFQSIIEASPLSSAQIRNSVRFLDKDHMMRKLINDCLEIPIIA